VRVISDEGFSVVEAGTASGVEESPPGENDLVILLSRAVPDQRVRALQAFARAHPKVRLIATMPPETSGAALRRALRCGADGIVLDNCLEETLAATVRAVGSGQLAVPRLLRRRFEPTPLSHREKEIVRLVVAGMTNRQIADKLYIAESTVKSHLSSAFEKLDARSRAEVSARVLDPEEGIGPAILATDPGGSPTPAG
jgi:DNA-binding NarL/FixJ family response regulator